MKATLKKPWRSPRGTLYPSGSTFSKSWSQSHSDLGSTWYNFSIPNGPYGIVLISDKIFDILTEDEKALRAMRKKVIDRHIEATKDPFRR